MFGVIVPDTPTSIAFCLPPPGRGMPYVKTIRPELPKWCEFEMGPERVAKEQEALRFRPEQWGMKKASDDSEYMFLNLGQTIPASTVFFVLPCS